MVWSRFEVNEKRLIKELLEIVILLVKYKNICFLLPVPPHQKKKTKGQGTAGPLRARHRAIWFLCVIPFHPKSNPGESVFLFPFYWWRKEVHRSLVTCPKTRGSRWQNLFPNRGLWGMKVAENQEILRKQNVAECYHPSPNLVPALSLSCVSLLPNRAPYTGYQTQESGTL